MSKKRQRTTAKSKSRGKHGGSRENAGRPNTFGKPNSSKRIALAEVYANALNIYSRAAAEVRRVPRGERAEEISGLHQFAKDLQDEIKERIARQVESGAIAKQDAALRLTAELEASQKTTAWKKHQAAVAGWQKREGGPWFRSWSSPSDMAIEATQLWYEARYGSKAPKERTIRRAYSEWKNRST